MAVNFDIEQALDVWNVSRRAFPFKNQIELLQTNHTWPVTGTWFKQGKLDVQGGTACEIKVMLTDSGTAAQVNPNDPADYTVGNVMATGYIPWTLMRDFDILGVDELNMNANAGGDIGTQLIELRKVRRLASAVSQSKLFESLGFLTPN
jgi:hypothetical protein